MTKSKITQPLQPIIQTKMNRAKFKGLKTEKPSLTVPDMTLSIPELILRYTQGRPLSTREPLFLDDDDPMSGIMPGTLDLVDIQEMGMQAQNELNEIKKRDTDRKAAKAAKQQEMKEKKQLDQLKLQLQNESTQGEK